MPFRVRDPRPSRRRFVRGAATSLPMLWPTLWTRLAAQAPCDAVPAGELVGTLPLYGPGAQDAPLGRLVGGEGLDARLFTDLSTLGPGRMLTPASEMFVRTGAPPGLATDPSVWRVRVPGPEGPRPMALADLLAGVRPMGPHVIECAGNSNPQHFGLMSAVEWDGVPLADVMARLTRPADAWGVLVSGLDDDTRPAFRSVPGASWIIPADDLTRLEPFLATAINGRPLGPDHGAPVRLVVPGWYGCTWIKWVNEIRWVGRDEPATSQMQEYARRTHQDGVPALARDYQAPAIDTAAMPIRVEQRRVGGVTEYHVVGIVWGGAAPVDSLTIRFGARDAGRAVRVCPPPATHRTWALWTYRWRPTEPGYYDISLRVSDASVRTRRLDLSFYIRRVRIDEV